MILKCRELNRVFILNKKNEERVALKKISFSVDRGEIYGILGPNGAGKTTLINILTTILNPSSYKELTINNLDVVKKSNQIKRKIGVVPSNSNSLYMKLTAKENLEFFGALYNIVGRKNSNKIEEVLRLVELTDYKDDYVENFSTGMKQRLLIARALIHNPELLILDEPTSGLDPRTANNIRRLLLQVNKGGISILIATHNMEEAESLCNRVSIFDKGEIINSGSPKELITSIGDKVTVATVNSNIEELAEILHKLEIDDYKLINSDGESSKIRVVDNNSNKNVIRLMEENGIIIDAYEKHNTTLEDVFFESLKKERENCEFNL